MEMFRFSNSKESIRIQLKEIENNFKVNSEFEKFQLKKIEITVLKIRKKLLIEFFKMIQIFKIFFWTA